MSSRETAVTRQAMFSARMPVARAAQSGRQGQTPARAPAGRRRWVACGRRQAAASAASAAAGLPVIDATAALIRDIGATHVVNLALPYQDLTIMEACLSTGAHYLDTANYEPRDEAKFDSVQVLIDQIAADARQARAVLAGA